MNANYEEIAVIQAGNGLQGLDMHDCTFTETGTALVMIYEPMAWDRSGSGGDAQGRTLGGVIQEIDIETGLVLYEWNSLDHVKLDESVSARGDDANAFFDYFHTNSVNLDSDGHILISARNTSTIYKIDRLTGDVIWRLGGKNSDFEMAEGTVFHLQHDAHRQADGNISLFDNASGDQEDDATVDSRGLILHLDMETMEASMVVEFVHPTGLLAATQGNLQALPDGTFFVGWGNHPSYSQFTVDGELIYNCVIAERIQSYRAYSWPWIGRPTTKPDMVVTGQGTQRTAWVSWNGATEVTHWRIWTPTNRTSLEEVVTVPRAGFETQVVLPEGTTGVVVEALDQYGLVLGTSDLAGA